MADEGHERRDRGPLDPDRFRTLPDRVPFEDMVEEVPADEPAPDTTPDPNREVAWRWGIGM